MAEAEVPPVPKIKELETLTNTSLITLARGLGKEVDGLTFPMLLNLPTTTIINIIYDVNEYGLLYDKDASQQTAVVEKCLLLWKEYTKDVKNKDRVKQIERALREMGKAELADSVMERYQNHQEISADIFA